MPSQSELELDQKPGTTPNQKPDEDLAYYESRRGQGWEDPNNMKILTEWIHYAAVYLDICPKLLKVIRRHFDSIQLLT